MAWIHEKHGWKSDTPFVEDQKPKEKPTKKKQKKITRKKRKYRNTPPKK
jgi:hypothetical protein